MWRISDTWRILDFLLYLLILQIYNFDVCPTRHLMHTAMCGRQIQDDSAIVER